MANNTPYNKPYDYSIVIDPAEDFPQNTLVAVSIVVGDRHSPSNVLHHSYSFRTFDTVGPVCSQFSPEPGSTDVPVDSNIMFKCSDSGVGVDINSVVIVVDNIIYRRSGANTFTYSGDSSEYIITVNPDTNWSESYAFEVIINAYDFSGNHSMDRFLMDWLPALGILSVRIAIARIAPVKLVFLTKILPRRNVKHFLALRTLGSSPF